MKSQDWQTLVATFAPQVRLSVKPLTPFTNPDQYQPSSIDWFLDRCVLVDHLDPTFLISPVDRESLVQNPESSRRLSPTSKEVYQGDRGSSGQWQVYAHIRNSVSPPSIEGQGWIDIQYWFFYPYNGASGGLGKPMGEFHGQHEGDWEHVTVRVADWRNVASLSAANIRGVFYAAHTSAEGKWILESASAPREGAYGLVDGSHPIVYSAWHTHASYEYAGTISRDVRAEIAGIPTEISVVGNDYTSDDGIDWGPLDAAGIEISQIDADVYQAGDEMLEPEGWLVYEGRWGLKDGPPVGPAQKGAWRSDGMNGYYNLLDELGPIGEDWGDSRYATAMAMGQLKPAADLEALPLVAYGRNNGDHFRVGLYRWNGTAFEAQASAGDDWDKSISCTGLDFGYFGRDQVIGAAKSSGNTSRFQIYRLDGNQLVQVAYGGDDWGKDRACTAIAFGASSQGTIVAVGRNLGDNLRYAIYGPGTTAAAKLLFSGGEDWPENQSCMGVALATSGDLTLLAVAKSAGSGSRFELHQITSTGLELIQEGGKDWGSDRYCSAITLGVLGDRPVLALGRNAGNNDRLLIYGIEGRELKPIAATGKDWTYDLGVSGIALGMLNGEGVVAVSLLGKPGQVLVFRLEGNQLVQFDAIGDGWGDDRCATCVALGNLGSLAVIGYGRSSGNNQRGAVLEWE